MPIETEQYASWVGLIYVFNLIVGTGPLTLPAGFASAGWILSTFLLILLCFVSFICVTYVIESIACVNAANQRKPLNSNENDEDESEQEQLITEETAIIRNARISRQNYNLDTKVELGEMSDFFLSKSMRILFYAALCIYLFGDLSIYAAAVSKTLVDLSCNTSNETGDFTNEKCSTESSMHKTDVYRIYVGIFALILGPLTYFNVQKTKYLQMGTMCLRLTAFLIMLILAIVRIAKNGPLGHPATFNYKGVPTLVGSSVYSFMCHHSLPNLIAPFSNKGGINMKLGGDMIVICIFYILLSLTGVFAFAEIQDLYTLNFIPEHPEQSSFLMDSVCYFLGAFPLFTLSTSFPIIAITLQNNLKALFLKNHVRYSFFIRRLLFPTVVLIPPILIALTTHDLKRLVEITGSYPGVFVQYICPVILAYYARRKCLLLFGRVENRFSSPFKSNFWFAFVLIWATVCIAFETCNFVLKRTD